MARKEQERKGPPVIENRKARFNYEILETLEAGLALVGTEVKSLRLGQANLVDAYAVAQGDELFLLNLRIQPYQNASHFNHEEARTRKLLVHRAEIRKLRVQIQEKRLTLIPLKIYFNDRGKVKVLLGLGRGKKLADKRETEKRADADREIARALTERG
jgi:SsrA-binding protein